jgi:hypothetical protein
MSILATIGLIFGVCFFVFLVVLLNVAVRMRKEKYQIPYVMSQLPRTYDSRGDLSWDRFNDLSATATAGSHR